jgi:hypothetical protein
VSRRAGAAWLAGSWLVLLALSVAVAWGAPWLENIDLACGTAAHDLTLSHPTLRTFWLRDAALQAPAVLDAALLALAVGTAARLGDI